MKKKAIIALLLAGSFTFGAATMTGCNIIGSSGNSQTQTEQSTVAVTGVTISKDALELTVGQTETISAGISPSNATDKSASWSSSNQSVATVDQYGTITAVGAGTATVTVTTTDGAKTASCTVTVTAASSTDGQPATVPVTSIAVTPKTAQLKAGETKTLSATVSPMNATDKTYSWSSDNTEVATVNEEGTVTAIKAGTVKIIATAAGGKTDFCTVTVTANATINPNPAPGDYDPNDPNVDPDNPDDDDPAQDTTVHVTGVSISEGSFSLVEGEFRQLSATVAPANATNSAVTWSSSATGVATVDQTGKVTAIKDGTAVITVASVDGNKTATCTVTVTKPASKPEPAITYTVKFFSDGNQIGATQTVNDGALISAPSVTKEGYYVTGWGTSSASGANYDFSSGVKQNLELHAKWEKLADGVSYYYAGNECAAFEWSDANPANATVQYKLSTESAYKTVDSELVRASSTNGVARVDVVGLKGNATYDFKITNSSGGAYAIGSLPIAAHDRSGYAHFGKTDGVGAYQDDGTLKSNAKVYYVTESTKNNIDGKGNSVAELLASLGSSSPTTVIRIIGTVKCPQYLSANNLDGSITDIDGIIRKDQGNDSYWNMIDINNASNITVEGIGEDATIFQFGFTWKKCSSIEVRNLTFTDYPEDACSFEGATSAPQTYKNFWLHHSVFNIGKNGWDKTDEQDKGDGDGATDLKGVSNVTFSYLQYNGCHKTGLVGGDDKHLTCNVTFHHNYYNGNQQRLPLGRQANMHMYNNYYHQSTMYSISLRANAYAFLENNYFDNSNGTCTIEIRNSSKEANYGYAKLYNNKFAVDNSVADRKYMQYVYDGNTTYFDGGDYIVEVANRTDPVASTNTFCQNFDTNANYFYYDAANHVTDVKVMFTAEETKQYVPLLAGVQKRDGDVTLGGYGSANQGGTTGGSGNTGTESGGNTVTSYKGTYTLTVDSNKIIYETAEGSNVKAEDLVYTYSLTYGADFLKFEDGKEITLKLKVESGQKVSLSLDGRSGSNGNAATLMCDFTDTVLSLNGTGSAVFSADTYTQGATPETSIIKFNVTETGEATITLTRKDRTVKLYKMVITISD